MRIEYNCRIRTKSHERQVCHGRSFKFRSLAVAGFGGKDWAIGNLGNPFRR